MFYISTIITLYGEQSVTNWGENFYNPINGIAFVILGFVIFSLSFVGDIHRYKQARKL